MIQLHEHVFAAGAVRDGTTYRYCVVSECDHALSMSGKRSTVRRNDDTAFYKAMAVKHEG